MEQQFDVNEYSVEQGSQFIAENAARVETYQGGAKYWALAAGYIKVFNYLGDIARLQSDTSLPDNYKDMGTLMITLQAFGGVTAFADIPMTVEEMWELGNTVPPNLADQMTKQEYFQYLNTNYGLPLNEEGDLSFPRALWNPDGSEPAPSWLELERDENSPNVVESLDPSDPTVPESPAGYILLPENRDSVPYANDALAGVVEASTYGSPLVLDLGAVGISMAALDSADSVYWDIDQDGFAEASGWIGPEEGLLAIDINGDGIINDNGELFGTEETDGFTILSQYDSNADSVINSTDAQYNNLLVWVDSNSDGYSQEGELQTLTQLNISSINLNAQQVDYDISGNLITHTSSFVIDGQTREIVDAWFAFDNVNTIYNLDYTLDVRTLFLPTIRGYGNLPDLQIAMSQNETLLIMVEEVAVANRQDILDPVFNIR